MPNINQPKIAILPHLVPAASTQRLLLFTIRRMAVGGLHDAHASHALMGTFGLNHKRVQMFMRAFLAELARSSTRTITLAPSCCRRMTNDEACLLRTIRMAEQEPRLIHAELSMLIGTSDARAPLAAAIGLADVLADLGHSLN